MIERNRFFVNDEFNLGMGEVFFQDRRGGCAPTINPN
jgi:hypothetical protein